jgi:hypothetical protein
LTASSVARLSRVRGEHLRVERGRHQDVAPADDEGRAAEIGRREQQRPRRAVGLLLPPIRERQAERTAVAEGGLDLLAEIAGDHDRPPHAAARQTAEDTREDRLARHREERLRRRRRQRAHPRSASRGQHHGGVDRRHGQVVPRRANVERAPAAAHPRADTACSTSAFICVSLPPAHDAIGAGRPKLDIRAPYHGLCATIERFPTVGDGLQRPDDHLPRARGHEQRARQRPAPLASAGATASRC